MKVNMALISDTNEELKNTDIDNADVNDTADTSEPDRDEDEIDESSKHSKLKTFILVAAMIGGFGLFVWNMTGLVNNMRLDNQGHAMNIVYEMEELEDFMNGNDSSSLSDNSADDYEKNKVSTEAIRDGPEYQNDDNDEITELKEELKKANDDIALKQQELNIAEEMLDHSLQEQERLQNELDSVNAGMNQ